MMAKDKISSENLRQIRC